MWKVRKEKIREDDIIVPGGYISIEDFNRMSSTAAAAGRIRFLAQIRKSKISRIFP